MQMHESVLMQLSQKGPRWHDDICGPSPLPSSPASPSTVAYVTSLVAATCCLSLLLPSAHTLASKSSFLMVVPSCHKENSTSDLSFMMDDPKHMQSRSIYKNWNKCSSSIFHTRDEGTIPNHRTKPTPPVDDLNLDCALQKAGWICYDLRVFKTAEATLGFEGSDVP